MSFFAILLASLVGSPHCVGMCGGFVTFYSNQSEGRILPHFAYNLGRLITYCTLGALAGLFGASFNAAGEILGYQRVVGLIIGVLMIAWGVAAFFQLNILSRIFAHDGFVFRTLGRPVRAILAAQTLRKNPALLAFLMGLGTTFLPCGWLYAFVSVAMVSGDPFTGALMMFAFWAGTVPLLALTGGFSSIITARLGRFVPRATALLVVAAGIFALSTHLQAGVDHSAHMKHMGHGAHVTPSQPVTNSQDLQDHSHHMH